MLMFDNSIFASFIPQLLMLLGYLSCIFAPILPSLTSTPSEHVAPEIEIDYVERAASITSVSKSDNYFYYFDFQYDVECVHESNTTFNVDFKEKEISYGKKESTLIDEFFSYSLFSRPPPFSLL